MVHVYSSYPAVRLELNGKTIGEQKITAASRLTATFNIEYQPGILKAIALQNGLPVDSVTLQTAGKPAQVMLWADRSTIHSGDGDLSYVTAEIVDENGHLVPDAAIPLQFSIEGAGKIVAAANANPSDMESFQRPEHDTFRGKCLIIVGPKGDPGKIKLKVTGKGLKGGEVTIHTQ